MLVLYFVRTRRVCSVITLTNCHLLANVRVRFQIIFASSRTVASSVRSSTRTVRANAALCNYCPLLPTFKADQKGEEGTQVKMMKTTDCKDLESAVKESDDKLVPEMKDVRASSSCPKRTNCSKTYKVILVSSNVAFILVCVGILLFCLIRFVLPVKFTKTSDNFMSVMIPSSLTQASISAAGLLAVGWQISWPLVCYSLVLVMPLSSSLYWIYISFNGLSGVQDSGWVLLLILSCCCGTWIVQIAVSLLLFCHVKKSNQVKMGLCLDASQNGQQKDGQLLQTDCYLFD